MNHDQWSTQRSAGTVTIRTSTFDTTRQMILPADPIKLHLEALWRTQSPQLIGSMARLVGDLDRAEELAQDTFVIALEQWPKDGLPANPAAWLMTTARRRAIDGLRRKTKAAQILSSLEQEARHANDGQFEPELADDYGDDLLRLLFTACHPLLSAEARVALTLKLLGGLRTHEIARAFLQTEATIAQRIVRAKRTLTEAAVPFEVPAGEQRAQRLASVLEVVYLIYNEGYAASAGADWMRPALCEDALRLGRLLIRLAPREPEVHALLALMELQSSRTAARSGPDGAPVLLLEQDRSRWDAAAIKRGLDALQSSGALTTNPGPYQLLACIAACHARAERASDTPWPQIVAHYDALLRLSPSPVVALNRAVALAMASGPQAGLDAVDELSAHPALRHYHLLPSVRGDLLAKLGRNREAAEQFRHAAALAQNARERELLLARLAQVS